MFYVFYVYMSQVPEIKLMMMISAINSTNKTWFILLTKLLTITVSQLLWAPLLFYHCWIILPVYLLFIHC